MEIILSVWNYVLEHIDQLGKVTAGVTVVAMAFITGIKKFYLHYKAKSSKKTTKLIKYLKNYSSYMDAEDKALTKTCINDEIMRDISRLPSPNNRKDLIYIFNRIEKRQYINAIYKLQNNIEKVNGHYKVIISGVSFLPIFYKLLGVFSGLLFLLFIMLGALSIFEEKNVLIMFAFLIISVVYEFLGLYFFSFFPSRKSINKINIELSKFEAL
jgi:hypothetical protein